MECLSCGKELKAFGNKKRCGDEKVKGTCAQIRRVFRSKEYCLAKKEGRKSEIASKRIKCAYCDFELGAEDSGRTLHGTQDDKESCAYLMLLRRNTEAAEERRAIKIDNQKLIITDPEHHWNKYRSVCSSGMV